MPTPVTTPEFLELLSKSDLLDRDRLQTYLRDQPPASSLPQQPSDVARALVRDGLLTPFQANQLLLGKWRGFSIGEYKVLEKIGAGGMAGVYLCEHKASGQRVAIKVLPPTKAEDPECLKRFYREVRVCATFDHPNLVKAFDAGQDGQMHFLVLEYVEGSSFQDIVDQHGPMETARAVQYIRQAAVGLQHAHEAGLVHRDIKPGNLILDRTGTVKILDMGVARFFNDEGSVLTQGMLGTADYLAPEQAMDSHAVDNRADIYSLGATFYYLLTGSPPFGDGKSLGQKLIAHQLHKPKPVRSVRPDVPAPLANVLDHMMAKDPADRYQTPQEVARALEPWTRIPIAPPPPAEMPRLCAAARGDGSARTTQTAISLSSLREKLTSGAIPMANVREKLAADTLVPGSARANGKNGSAAPTTHVPGPIPCLTPPMSSGPAVEAQPLPFGLSAADLAPLAAQDSESRGSDGHWFWWGLVFVGVIIGGSTAMALWQRFFGG